MRSETPASCETCGDDGYLIGDKADAHGERTDDKQPCPACAVDDDEDEDDTSDFERMPLDFDDINDRRLDVGGEA